MAESKGRLKTAKLLLDAAVAEQYGVLTETEIKGLVVNQKWCRAIEQTVSAEVDNCLRSLVARLHELGVRYERPLKAVSDETRALSERTEGHLKKMGATWP